jgi:hypothetical protein
MGSVGEERGRAMERRGERWPGWRVVKRDGRKDWAQRVAIKIRTWGGAGPQRSEPHHAALQQMDRHEILLFSLFTSL